MLIALICFSFFYIKNKLIMNTIVNNSYTKNSILAFIKNLVSRKTYNGIKQILSPCCYPHLLEASLVCYGSHTGNYTATLTFDKDISVGSYIIIYVDNAIVTLHDSAGVPSLPVVTPGKVQIFSDLHTNGPGAGSRVIRATIISPISDFNHAVYTLTTGVTTTLPDCK